MGPDPPEKSHIGFQAILVNHKATYPTLNVGPSSARQRNAIEMAFRWWVDDGRLIVVLDPLSSHQLKKQRKTKNSQIWTPSDKTSESAHEIFFVLVDINLNFYVDVYRISECMNAFFKSFR